MKNGKTELKLSPWQRFKHALYEKLWHPDEAAEEIGTTVEALRTRIYRGLKNESGKKTPLDEKILSFIEREKIDYDIKHRS